MSYASLSGLPDATNTPSWWWDTRAELDMLDEPRAEIAHEAWVMGDQPTSDRWVDDGSKEILITEYSHGAYVMREEFEMEMCHPDCCSNCAAGRAASATWEWREIAEHLL